MEMKSVMLDFIVDAWFPPTCGGCSDEGMWLCRRCTLAFQSITNQCFGCRRPSVGGRFCFTCAGTWPLDGVNAAASYTEEAVRNTIYSLKYHYIASLATALAPLVADAVCIHLADAQNPILVPIPLANPRHRWRGFNQSEILARHASTITHIPYMTALTRTRNTLVQADLPHEERMTNVAGAFQLQQRVSIAGKDIILIDDVATTGSTLRAAADACKMAGANKVFASVIAIG